MVKAAKFLEGFSGKLGEQWIASLMTPAFLFWLGGLLAASDRLGWQTLQNRFKALNLSEPEEIALLVFALIVVAVSGVVVEQFNFGMLRLLEGYWPRWLRFLRYPLQQRQQRRWKSINQTFQRLSKKRRSGSLSAQEQLDYARASNLRRQFPTRLPANQSSDPLAHLMPTRLGNIIRVAEDRPRERYGLETIACWPRLWLLLPESTQEELAAARSELNRSILLWLWGLLFWIWQLWVWWAIPLGLAVMAVSYQWAIQAALIYGQLLEATFDVHRILLYNALRWPLPENPVEERTQGRLLSQYLIAGSDRSTPTFTPNA